ncbi:WD repeat-containing protein 90-like isoform X2 [Oscarella lobularis]|uniref:WD repeat-containing protein 90-like isoform X2 n=1 Tax=Oscarella lobularis TaxID=121494 RepID=UPI00331387FD
MSRLWQHPYVNVFKHFGVGEWKKCSKQGDVTTTMDKSIKSTVYRIQGSIPASNFIQIPRVLSQSLHLTGSFIYVLFKPIAGKFFVIHIDVTTMDHLITRISISNLFKELKATATSLQIPFIPSSPVPGESRWAFLILDLKSTLTKYQNRRYQCVKNVKLCANLLVKNLFTSDILFDPMIPENVKRRREYAALLREGTMPVPKEMAFPVPKDAAEWLELYDIMRFPDERNVVPVAMSTAVAVETTRRLMGEENVAPPLPQASVEKKKKKRKEMTKRELPEVGVNEPVKIEADHRGEIHVYAESDDDVRIHEEPIENNSSFVQASTSRKQNYKSLTPDPILKLRHVIGYSGSACRQLLWSHDCCEVVFACHGVIVAMEAVSRQQRFFIGHTQPVSAFSLNSSSTLLASTQSGSNPVIRLWNFPKGHSLAIIQSQATSLHAISLSHSGSVLVTVGRDTHGKHFVCVRDVSSADVTSRKPRHLHSLRISTISKAHTDVHVACLKIAPFDDTRMISCGRDNVRFWRVKDNTLRSCPVNLGEHHQVNFTDIAFELAYQANQPIDDRKIYASSESGHVFEMSYKDVCLLRVVPASPLPHPSIPSVATSHVDSAHSVRCIAASEVFLAVGSADGLLRLWKTDFTGPFLETELEGGVLSVCVSSDGLKVAVSSDKGDIGVLDASSQSCTTLLRSHADAVLAVDVHNRRQHFVTSSEDQTIRVWNLAQNAQEFDFQAPDEIPSCIAYHPTRNCFAFGSDIGCVRVFHVTNTNLLAEYRHHSERVCGLVFTPDGQRLISCSTDGLIVLYDSTQQSCPVVRILANVVARKLPATSSSHVLAVNAASTQAALIGPSQYAVTVVDPITLDEVLCLDIGSVLAEPNSGGPADSELDSPTQVSFSSGHILVMTSQCRLLKFDSETGRILTEVSNIHRSSCTSMVVSPNGKYLSTAGDKVIKVWDYKMKLDINFQVFIGHSSDISEMRFTPDGSTLVTVGDAIFVWDFLGKPTRQRVAWSDDVTENDGDDDDDRLTAADLIPRRDVPVPTPRSPPTSKRSLVLDTTVEAEQTSVPPRQLQRPPRENRYEDESESSSSYDVAEIDPALPSEEDLGLIEDMSTSEPIAFCHFRARKKGSSLAKRCYVAPQDEAGIQLDSVLGYNGNGRNNMIWHYQTGLFAYSCGSLVVVENLATSQQKQLIGHVEEISTMAVQHDGQVLASASGASRRSPSQINIWDVATLTCKKVLSYHKAQIVSLEFSRDDQYMLSTGDYAEPVLALWDARDFDLLTVARCSPAAAFHSIAWNPYVAGEFVTVGSNAAALQFWRIEEKGDQVEFNVFEPEIPKEIKRSARKNRFLEFTSLCYADEKTLYVGSTAGVISAWNLMTNTCCLHWQAEDAEITQIFSNGDYLVCGGVNGKVSLWCVAGVRDALQDEESRKATSITVESDMTLDGPLTAASFDDDFELGIVGTAHGTLWCVNWKDKTMVHMVTGHPKKITGISFIGPTFDLFGSSSDDGCLRIWSGTEREQRLQFQVVNQPCTCLCFSPVIDLPSDHSSDKPCYPLCAGGYANGTIRFFDINAEDMRRKIQPHGSAITCMEFSKDGHVLISACLSGLVAVSSPSTGLTIRIIREHKRVPISDLSVANTDDGKCLWLAAARDQRVSVWQSDWSTDRCEIVDWLTFPAPPIDERQKSGEEWFRDIPPTLARFCPTDPSLIVYSGYSLNKEMLIYSLEQKLVIRSLTLTHWPTCIDVSPNGHLIAVGCGDRIVKIIDFDAGTFQDFTSHDDCVAAVQFSFDSKRLLSVSHSNIHAWYVAH